MQPELQSSQNSYQTPVAVNEVALQQQRVLRNTYLLLALSLIPTGIGALLGINMNFGFMRASPIVSSLVLLAVIYGMFFAIEKNRDSGLGVALLLGLTHAGAERPRHLVESDGRAVRPRSRRWNQE